MLKRPQLSVSVLALLLLAGCGSDAPSTAPTPAPSPTPAPPPPTQPTVALTGVVTGAETGQPLENATVRVLGDREWEPLFSTLTNARGEYRFPFLRPGNFNLAASRTDHVERRAGVFADGRATLNFALPRRTFLPLSGTIVRIDTRAPLAGVTVQVLTEGPDQARIAKTDASGRYAFPALQGGRTMLRARLKGFQQSQATVEINGTNTLDFGLTPLPRSSLAGRVTAADTGAPIAGASVFGTGSSIFADNHNEGRTTTTDANGEYRFDDLVAGNSNFGARAPGYRQRNAGVFVNGVNRLDFVLPRE